MQGQIIKALAGFYYVESDGQVYQTRARGNFRKKGHTPYVGDWVDFSAEENSEGYILKIHERKNSLVRPIPLVILTKLWLSCPSKNLTLIATCWIASWFS